MAESFEETYGVSEEEVAKQREAHEAKAPEDLAYVAGKNAASDDFARAHGVDACPFPAGSEREAWLRGFGEGLDKQLDIRELRQAVAAEVQG